MSKRNKIKTAPVEKVATLSGEQFNTLIRYIDGLKLKRIEFQQEFAQLEQRLNAYYVDIAKQYDLPAPFKTLAWDEKQLKIKVT